MAEHDRYPSHNAALDYLEDTPPRLRGVSPGKVSLTSRLPAPSSSSGFIQRQASEQSASGGSPMPDANVPDVATPEMPAIPTLPDIPATASGSEPGAAHRDPTTGLSASITEDLGAAEEGAAVAHEQDSNAKAVKLQPATKSGAAEPGTAEKKKDEKSGKPGPAPKSESGSKVQRKEGSPVPVATNVHQTADAGLAGATRSLPHLDRIQAAFGKHDVSHARVAVGGAAATNSANLGALAYTRGSQIAFASEPDVRLAAHEAAHVVQQRRGVHLSGDVGAVGDTYEVHADAVADAVVRGDSAEALLDDVSGSGSGEGIQRFAGSVKNDPLAAAPTVTTMTPLPAPQEKGLELVTQTSAGAWFEPIQSSRQEFNSAMPAASSAVDQAKAAAKPKKKPTENDRNLSGLGSQYTAAVGRAHGAVTEIKGKTEAIAALMGQSQAWSTFVETEKERRELTAEQTQAIEAAKESAKQAAETAEAFFGGVKLVVEIGLEPGAAATKLGMYAFEALCKSITGQIGDATQAAEAAKARFAGQLANVNSKNAAAAKDLAGSIQKQAEAGKTSIIGMKERLKADLELARDMLQQIMNAENDSKVLAALKSFVTKMSPLAVAHQKAIGTAQGSPGFTLDWMSWMSGLMKAYSADMHARRVRYQTKYKFTEEERQRRNKEADAARRQGKNWHAEDDGSGAAHDWDEDWDPSGDKQRLTQQITDLGVGMMTSTLIAVWFVMRKSEMTTELPMASDEFEKVVIDAMDAIKKLVMK